ncbi:MAG: LacI family DNA-binding transcriptional regulator [Anaerolineae bacterium]
MPTIRDVAREAGVGLGTVSRVLNDSPLVSETTRQHVLEIIEKLDYKPNPVARRLSLGKTLTVAVIVPFFTRPAFSERLNGVVSLLSQSPYDLLIYNVDTPELRRRCFENLPPRELVDGALLLSLPPFDEEAQRLTEVEFPIVLIDSEHPALEMFHQVNVDDVAGGELATRHLVELGHRRIGFIGDIIDNPFNFRSSRDRYRGYRNVLEAAGLPFQVAYYAEGEHGRHQARELAREMLAQPERPTAIFAASDTQAVGVLEAARDLGLAVPEDLSVIGYDDIELADIMQLTTVRQMLFESGRRGVELLLHTLKQPDIKPVHEYLDVELVIRNSTAPPSSA